jgi:hypothetical protein
MRALPLLVLLSLVPAPSRACPCPSGDPVITAPPARPTGPPLLVRLLAEGRVSLDAYGTRGLDRADVTELRLESTLVVSPIDRLSLSLLVPLAHREVVRANLSRETVFGLADPELRARYTVLRSRAGGLHELDVVAGVDLPVSPEARRPDGAAISMEAMIASGSADPLAGLAYRFVGDPVGVALALTWRLPTTGHQAMTMGPSLDGALWVSGAVLPELIVRGAIEARWELPAQMPDGPMPNTGGGIVRVGGDVLARPLPELAVGVGVRGPALDLMIGERDPGLTASLLVAGEVAR